jgi:hypothetical protein
VKEQRSGRGSAYGYGYGYGNYGYSYGGYGAYDPRSTYSYYQQDEAAQPTLPADASSAAQPWLAQLNTWRQRVVRWIDS